LQETNNKHARYIETLVKSNNSEIWKETNFVEKLKSLWSDESMRTSWESSDATLSNLNYFMEKIDIIATDAFIPNNDDIFRSRQRTAGAANTDFIIAKQKWIFKDAGGQASERKLWPDIIETGLHAVMFFVALDEYDTPSDTEHGKTKMDESLDAWSELINLPSVQSSCILLFLNKVDLFTKKFQKDSSSFKKIFNQKNNEVTLSDAISIVGDRYTHNIDTQIFNKIYVTPVNSLDTELVTSVFKQVKVHVIKNLGNKK
jgi:guanine nucleotide-binding protein subunit alpha